MFEIATLNSYSIGMIMVRGMIRLRQVQAGAAPGCLLRGGGGKMSRYILLREPNNFAPALKSRSAGGGGGGGVSDTVSTVLKNMV